MEKEPTMKGFEEDPREYSHDEISVICRDELLHMQNMDETIYDFAEENDGKKTTDKELRAKFAAMVSKEK